MMAKPVKALESALSDDSVFNDISQLQSHITMNERFFKFAHALQTEFLMPRISYFTLCEKGLGRSEQLEPTSKHLQVRELNRTGNC